MERTTSSSSAGSNSSAVSSENDKVSKWTEGRRSRESLSSASSRSAASTTATDDPRALLAPPSPQLMIGPVSLPSDEPEPSSKPPRLDLEKHATPEADVEMLPRGSSKKEAVDGGPGGNPANVGGGSEDAGSYYCCFPCCCRCTRLQYLLSICPTLCDPKKRRKASASSAPETELEAATMGSKSSDSFVFSSSVDDKVAAAAQTPEFQSQHGRFFPSPDHHDATVEK